MTISKSIDRLMIDNYVESLDVANLPAQVVTNAGGGAAGLGSLLLSGEDQANFVLGIAYKPTGSSTYALTWDLSAAYETSSVAKASAGLVFKAFGRNKNAATRYFQIYNTASVPADGAVPVFEYEVDATSSFEFDLSPGMFNTVGISWANSTTSGTKTIGGADFFVSLGFK